VATTMGTRGGCDCLQSGIHRLRQRAQKARFAYEMALGYNYASESVAWAYAVGSCRLRGRRQAMPKYEAAFRSCRRETAGRCAMFPSLSLYVIAWTRFVDCRSGAIFGPAGGGIGVKYTMQSLALLSDILPEGGIVVRGGYERLLSLRCSGMTMAMSTTWCGRSISHLD